MGVMDPPALLPGVFHAGVPSVAPSPAGLTIPFNQTGEQIKAPYDFVARLELKRVALFEDAPDADVASGSAPEPTPGEVTA